MIKRFTPYIIVKYGDQEKRTGGRISPTGSILWDTHLIFRAYTSSPQPFLVMLFMETAVQPTSIYPY